MRHEHQSGTREPQWSHGAKTNPGDAIKTAVEKVRAATALMREAWWFPSIAPVNPGDTPEVMLAERSLPGSFMVNATGERFANESMDYMSFGQRYLDLEEAGTSTGEMWLVFEQKYRNSYVLGTQLFPGMPLPQAWSDAGIAVRGFTPPGAR